MMENPLLIPSSINVLRINATALVGATEEEGRALEKALSLTSTNEYGKAFTLKLYTKFGDGIYQIPRGLLNGYPSVYSWYFNQFVNHFTSILSETQRESVDKINNFFENPSHYGGILEAPTGTGKTVMALDIALGIGYKTLIVVPTTYLLTQWQQRILDHTDIKPEEIGVIQSDRCEVEGKKIVVAMLHSLVQREYQKNIYDSFGLVIFDEVHTLGAATFSRVCYMFDSRYRLGLSATPKRKDGMANVFKYHIGEVIATNNRLLVTPKVYVISYTNPACSEVGCINRWNSKFNNARWLTKIAKVDHRNIVLVKLIVQAYERGHKVLVLSDRLEQLYTLRELLAHIPDVGMITAKLKEPDKGIILATYGSAALGMDIPALSCVILATPRVDIVQPIGRVLRKCVGKRDPEVLDLVDKSSKTMVGWGMARVKRYKKFTNDIVYKELL